MVSASPARSRRTSPRTAATLVELVMAFAVALALLADREAAGYDAATAARLATLVRGWWTPPPTSSSTAGIPRRQGPPPT